LSLYVQISLFAGVVIMVLVGVLWGLRHYRKTPKIDRLLRRQLRRLKVPFLHDIYLPDGMDGQIHIDYLARAGDTIFVIDVIHCDGLLFAGDRMDRWSEVKGMRTYRFDNPLNGNLMRTGSVRSLVPNMARHRGPGCPSLISEFSQGAYVGSGAATQG
jgi:hypothetical protein